MTKKTWSEIQAERAAEFWQDVKTGATYARDDIRQKLVEEPWFGRATTPQMFAQQGVDYSRELGWTHPGQDTGRAPANVHVTINNSNVARADTKVDIHSHGREPFKDRGWTKPATHDKGKADLGWCKPISQAERDQAAQAQERDKAREQEPER